MDTALNDMKKTYVIKPILNNIAFLVHATDGLKTCTMQLTAAVKNKTTLPDIIIYCIINLHHHEGQ